MTDAIAQTAWAEFQQIEAEGGIDNVAPFEARIKAAAKIRADKAEPILGVTLHPAENSREAKVRSKYKAGADS